MVSGFYIDGHGTLWAPTEGGLSRIKDGHILTLTSQNGLPCNTVHWMMEDDARSVWLYLACGLVRIGWSELDAWASHPKQTIHATVFDRSDGVTSHRLSAGYNAVVAKSSDGKLWFVRNVGVSVIDPHHLAFNERPPPVHIERVTADDKIYDATNGLRLPARLRDLSIDYTALSLAAPEKVRFRYMLEGQDADWKEVVNDRQVQYSNLPPRAYRFRVVASNNSGCGTRPAQRWPSRSRRRITRHGGSGARRRRGPRSHVGGYRRAFARSRGSTSDARRTRQRAHAHRAGTARHAAAKLPRSAAAIPDRVVPAAGAPGRRERELDGAIDRAAKAITEGRDGAGIADLHHRKERPRAGDQRAGHSSRPTAAAADRHSCGRRRRDARAPSDSS